MSETATQEPTTQEATPTTETAAAKPERNKPDALTFATAWNDVVDGVATFTKQSTPNKAVKKVEEGKPVPKSRQGVAAYLNMEYNAVVNRERTYLKRGIQLKEMPTGQRGSSLDVDDLNAKLAEQAKENAAAKEAAS